MRDSADSKTRIDRIFHDLSETDLYGLGYETPRAWWPSGGVSWEKLLESQRVLIVSEAGAGKTYECQQRQRLLWKAGQPAFFLDLSTLATTPVEGMLAPDESKKFAEWVRSQSEQAIFFLDSIDELRLTAGKFDQALKRLAKAIEGKLGLAKIIITTRPIPLDRKLIERYLPIPAAVTARATGENFANVVLEQTRRPQPRDIETKPWRNVGMLPLTPAQIKQFSVTQNVKDPESFLEEVYDRNVEEFATRPQDLIELCAFWRNNRKIGSHYEQVKAAIALKATQRVDRKERVSLSIEKAIEGASKLALAALLTKRLTIRYGSDANAHNPSVPALDPSKVLPDWTADEIATLLERPLFGFASYHRVRFHHRSVLEFLAAQRFNVMIEGGVALKTVKRLLFTTTSQSQKIVRPSLRPTTAWLAMLNHNIFADALALDPAILLDYADPQSLQPGQRASALEAYVERYGSGGRRGHDVPSIQVRRFASPDLCETVLRLWKTKIENPEVRTLLLQLISVGRLSACSDLAYEIANTPSMTEDERILAVDALVIFNDNRLHNLANDLKASPDKWSDRLTRRAAIALLPAHITFGDIIEIIRRTHEALRSVGEINYRLVRKIEDTTMDPAILEEGRNLLTLELAATATHNQQAGADIIVQKPEIVPVLIAICGRLKDLGLNHEWAVSSMIAICCSGGARRDKEELSALASALDDLRGEARAELFWEKDRFLLRLLGPTSAWQRAMNNYRHGAPRLSAEYDAEWIHRGIADKRLSFEEREVLLLSALKLMFRAAAITDEEIQALKALIADSNELTATIDQHTRPAEVTAEYQRLDREHQRYVRQEEKKKKKAHESWVRFWSEVIDYPEEMFAEDRSASTVWNLWQAMNSSGNESRTSGWNRAFFEQQFNKATADRLRQSLMPVWRKDKPTLASERPPEERNTSLMRWQLGLTAISAEAEDPQWVEHLSEAEAELACRYAVLNLNGLPTWLEDVVARFPKAVERTLGQELTHSLETYPEEHSMLFQSIKYAARPIMAVFLPRIMNCLRKASEDLAADGPHAKLQNIRYAIHTVLEAGDAGEKQELLLAAKEYLGTRHSDTQSEIWLPLLLQLEPTVGVEVLEKELADAPISREGKGVSWIARLFGRDISGPAINLSKESFTPQLLLRLIKLAYAHVRPSDDVTHDGAYSPDLRDHAEEGRNAILGAILEASGSEAYAAKLAMAADPLFTGFRERAIYLADKKIAEEADSAPFSEEDCAVLVRAGEGPPRTTTEMSDLMQDRMSDIEDLLLQEESPRELWATIDQEYLLRRELARRLREAAKGVYNVDQEAVTADEKETDIRLLATRGDQRGTIELKVGEKDRSANDLRNALKDQLLLKYMAAAESRAGCLVVSVATDRTWRHPSTNKTISFEELIAFLSDEADKLSKEVPGAVQLAVRGLDLRPRLAS